MTWHVIGPVGATRDLWVDVTGEGDPEYGEWISPAGHDVWEVLERQGPGALDIPVHWVPPQEHYGKRLRDWLWQTSLSPFKLLSVRMVDVLLDCGARLETFEVDIRWRSGDPVEGYLGVLEEVGGQGLVRSLWRDRRSADLVIVDEVLSALREAGMTGLEVEKVEWPFPGDHAEYWKRWDVD